MSGITLAAVIAEREQGERERGRLVREQVAMEARLRLATIVESSGDAIIGQDVDGIVVDWNKGAERLYGYSANEVIGRPISLFVPLGHSGNSIGIGKNNTIKHYETVHHRKDGTRVEVSTTMSAIRDPEGRIIGASVISRDMTEHKQAQEALRECEDRLRLLLNSTAEAIYGIDLEDRCMFCNPACLRTLGYQHDDEVLGQNMHNLIHHTRADGTALPIEECRVYGVTRTGEGVHAEDEVLWRANGTSFPVEYWSYPQRRGDEVVGAVVAFIDITQRKLSEAALASVSRRLIEAQEDERTRIARELHDDIGQRIAMLAIELESLQQLHLADDVNSRIGELRNQTSEIATDIQSLSHELHSAKLEYLGIASAIRSFCQEFGKQQKVEIDFNSHDLPSPLPADASLCLFRVLQEALHNSAKHSGVRRFEVRLWGTTREIHLTVSDSGAGFDRQAAKESRGLGLVSMEERLKLLHGTLTIESQPNRGTTVHARVPFSSDNDSTLAAG